MSALREIDRWFIDEVLPHEGRYLALARRLSENREQAADLVHDAYARLFCGEEWRTIDHPAAYVLRMVRNLAIQRMRRAQVVRITAVAHLDEHGEADSAPDPLDQAASGQMLRRLLHAVRDLPARCRQVLILRRFHELPPREVAARLGLSLSTMEKRLARALVLLSQALEREEIPAQQPHDTRKPEKRRAQ